MPPPDGPAQPATRPDGTSWNPGPKFHPRITASNLPAFEGCWKRFMLRRSLPPGWMRNKEQLYFSPLSFSYAWSREHSLEIRAFGTTEEGNSVCVRITQFPPYFFARLPDELNDKPVEEVNEMLRDYSRYLNLHLRNKMQPWERKKIDMAERVIHVDATHVEEHFPTPNYAGKEGVRFARFYGVHPSVIRSARIATEFPYGVEDTKTKDGNRRDGFLPDSFIARGVPETGFAPYEADVDFVVRFLTDKGLSPSAWWKIDKRATEIYGNARASTCNLELLVSHDMLSSEIPDAVATTVAPYIKCKFDIEVETSLRFPQPATSRVIQIALRLSIGNVAPQDLNEMVRGPMESGEYARKDKTVNISLCLGSVRPQTGFVPISFKTEEDLLWAFNELIPVLDVDDMAGHFTNGFDWWFLLERAKALGMTGFRFMGRVPFESAYSNVDVEREKRAAMSKQKRKGGAERTEQYATKIPGVCVWDFFYYAVAFVRDASSYSLNDLAAQFLKDKQKLDVEYALIAKMQMTEEGRTRLASYCDRDVLLTQLLDDKVKASPFLREMADLSFVPRQGLLDRKSVFRVTARWLYEAQRYDPKGRRYLMESKPMRKPVYRTQVPIVPGGKKQTLITGARVKATPAQRIQAKYSGGTVLEPCTGYYKDLVAVFDFKSLYPSIIRWRNICYVTILPAGRQDELMAKFGLTEDDVWHAPVYELSADGKTTVARISKETMPSFVKDKVMEGILPYIERTFDLMRSQKKDLMNDAYKGIVRLDEAFKTLNAITPDGILNREQRTKLLVLAAIYNNQQGCIKIFMNSLYGVMGAVEATFPLRDGARTVTSEARQAIEVARYNAETMFPAFLVEDEGEWRKIYDFYDPTHTDARVQEFIRTFNERKPEEGLPFKPEVIYGDTDSIFVRYRFFVSDDPDMPDLERVLRTEKYNDYIAAELTKVYGTPTMCLQFEKICTRTYLITKKKYILRMLLREGGKYTMKLKETGTTGVRRDGCQLQRIMCKRVKKALMEDSSPEQAIEAVRAILAYVMAGKATLDEVLMCSTISAPIANYKNPGPPHVELARKEMKAGARPFNKGDRVHYIVVGGLKTDAIRDRVRTPQDAIDNDIPYCKEYYGMQVIVKQARILLGPLVDTRTYEEKRKFQDWARVVGFQPDGEKRISEAKKQFKQEMHRTVDKLIMHGLSLEESRILEQSSIGCMFGEDTKEDESEPQFEDEDEDEADDVPDDPEILPDAPTDAEDDESLFEPHSSESAAPTSSSSSGAAGTAHAPEHAFAVPSGPPGKRARAEEDVPAGPASKRQKCSDESPAARPASFFSGCFRYASGGGVSAAFKSTKSIKNVGMQRVVKTVPKSSPLFKAIVVYDRCIRCNVTVPESRGYLCWDCEKAEPTLRRDEYNKQRIKTNALEKECHGRWKACYECRGRNLPAQDKDQCDITHCVNYVCPNWGRRKTVTRDLQKAHVRLTKLGLEQNDDEWVE